MSNVRRFEKKGLVYVRGCSRKVTVQKICKRAKNEEELREILEKIWSNPESSEEVLNELLEKNKELYMFEKMLEEIAVES